LNRSKYRHEIVPVMMKYFGYRAIGWISRHTDGDVFVFF